MRWRSWGLLIGVSTLISMLAATSVALGTPVVAGDYTGTTTQRNPADHHRWVVTFTISGQFVENLDFNINDKCPDGTRLIVHSFGYPRIRIHPKGQFAGRFGVIHGVPGEGSLIRGKVSGHTVTAYIDDFGLNKREHVLCRGATTFTAKPVSAAPSRAADPHHSATTHGSRTYSGRTSQRRTISFTVSGGYVRNLSYHIYDRCPGGRAIIDYDRGFTPIRIKADGSFGGKFIDPGKATAIVSGRVSGARVTGALTDTAKHPTYHTTCHGHTTFSLMPRGPRRGI